MADLKQIGNKVADYLMFREGTESLEGEVQPVVTTGSIVWGVILRSAIIIVISFFLIDVMDLREYWWFIAFLLWLGAAYPGWRQYNRFQEKMKVFKEETLCGQCRHFDSTSQLCRLLDEHPTKDYIPCEGLSWEPLQNDAEEI